MTIIISLDASVTIYWRS